VGYTGPQVTGPTGPIGATGYMASFINMNQVGTVAGPTTGYNRFYAPFNLTISRITANVGSPPLTANIVFQILKNNVSIGTFTINTTNYTMTPVTQTITMNTSDWLTVNMVSGTAQELRIQLQYN
jgi:hypothetical protein